MTQLTRLEGTNISFNQDFFDLASVKAFGQKDLPTLTLSDVDSIVPKASGPVELGDHVITQDESINQIMDQVIADMAKDSDFQSIIAKDKKQLLQQAEKNIQNSMTQDVDPKLLKNNMESLVITKTETDSGADYLINGEQVLHIPKQEQGTRLAASFEMILAWTMLIWHSVSFIATIVSIWMPKASGNRVKTVGKVVQKEASAWRKFINAMKRIKEAADNSEKVKFFLDAFTKINVFLQLKNVVKSILSNLKWYEITLAVLQFITAVAALFVTAGASMVAKMIKLASNLISIVQDVIHILKLEGKLSAQLETGEPSQVA